jgi:hypothetical protein
MKYKIKCLSVVILLITLTTYPILSLTIQDSSIIKISICPDSVLNDVSEYPIGINLDYFIDDDKYLKPKRSTAEALKEMKVKFLRYPGGNKSDFYFFSRKPYEKSMPTLARTGKEAVGGRGSMLKNNYSEFKYDVLDFDEFMELCKEVGAEPVLVVAADEYLIDYPENCTWSTKEQMVEHAVEWVKYANIKKKYNVKYWMIGNESWGPENKNSTAEIYARDVVDFSKAMKAVDPSIHIIPNSKSDEFWETVLTTCAGYIDDVCISNYPILNYKAGYKTYSDTVQDLNWLIKTAVNAIEKYASPEDKQKLRLIIAEYGPFDWEGKWSFINDMGTNLANFEITGKQLLEPKIAFSCFWNTRWISNISKKNSSFDALDRNGNLNANGLGLRIWGEFIGDLMVKTSSTKHIRSFASFSPKDNKLYVYILNKSDIAQKVSTDIEGYKTESISQTWELAGKNQKDTNPVWREVNLKKGERFQTVPATTIRVIEYSIMR